MNTIKIIQTAICLLAATFAMSSLDASTPAGKPEQKSSAESPSSTSAITAKLNNIVLPKLVCKDATVREIVAYLKQKSYELDVHEPNPARRGVNILLQADEKTSDALISLSLTNVTLAEVIRNLTSLANLESKVELDAVILSGGQSSAPIGK